MLSDFIKLFVCFGSAFLLSACSSTNSKPLLIDFSADSSAIVFSNVDQPGLLQLRSLAKGDTTLRQLISVLQTPSERDSMLKEQEVAGDVFVTDSSLVFIPVQPFVQGRDYLVLTHLNVEFGGLKDLMKGDLSNRIRPVQKLLTR